MDWYTLLIIGHIIGTSLGVGGATLSDLLFFKSVRGGAITTRDIETFHISSMVVWGGYVLLILSGIGFFVFYRLTGGGTFAFSGVFWVKMFIVTVILINGLIMHWRVIPLFESLNEPGRNHLKNLFLKSGKLIATTGATSIVSWYSVLILGVWLSATVPASILLLIYLTTLTGVIIVANAVVKKIGISLGNV